MKIAFAYNDDRISPVFDVSENLLLLDVGDDGQISRVKERLKSAGAFERAAELSALGVEALVCGAISAVQENALRSAGIDVAAFICGPTDAVVDAFLRGRLADAGFSMPGCCGRRGRMRRGRCGRGGRAFNGF